MDLTFIDWGYLVKETSAILIFSVFCMGLLESIKVTPITMKRRLRWLVLVVLTVISITICSVLLDVFFYATASWDFAALSGGLPILLGLTGFNTLVILLPILMSSIGGFWIYNRNRWEAIFVGTLGGLSVTVLESYVCDVLDMFFYQPSVDGLYYGEPPFWIETTINIVVLVCAYLLYRKFVCKALRDFLEQSGDNLRNFAKVPACSSLAFAILCATLHSFGFSCISVSWQNQVTYFLVLTCVVSAYVMLYWTTLRGISLSVHSMRVTAELDVARQIQASVLPSTFPAFPLRREFSLHAYMAPAKMVGGDFYDFFFVDENHLAFIVADVSGKGVPAAMFMMTTRSLIKNLTMVEGNDPGAILTRANRSLCEGNEMEMFVTAWLGILEIDSGVLTFANAGHNPPLLYKKGEGNRYLDHKTYRRSMMLGLRDGVTYKNNVIQLEPQDSLFLYTDGVTEACNDALEIFGEQRLKTTLDGVATCPPTQVLQAVEEAVQTFAQGVDQFDDITMLGLKIETPWPSMRVKPHPSQTEAVINFVEETLAAAGCPQKHIHRMCMCTDEIVSNVNQYSNASALTAFCRVLDGKTDLCFEDDGVAYNPLEETPPDLTLPLSERKIGGLGLLMTEKSTDYRHYAYLDGKNVFTLQAGF